MMYGNAVYGLSLCTYLRPTATAAVSSKAAVVSAIKAAAAQYAPFGKIDHSVSFKQLCISYDLLEPDLDASTISAFKGMVAKLIPDSQAFLSAAKPKNNIQDNFASSVAAMNSICAQAVGDFTNVAAMKTKILNVGLSPNQAITNLYDNGESYDLDERDALFYHAVTVGNFADLARHMPDRFYTQDQWKLIERGIYYTQQFYVVPNVQKQAALVYHREFMTTHYPPDQTTLHGNLYARPTNKQITTMISDS
jgi:hypothetical protein